MMTLFTFFLLVVTFFFLLFRYIKTSIVFLLITLSCFFIASSGILSRTLLTYLESSYIPKTQLHFKKNNFIVLLGGGAIQLPGTEILKPTVMAYSRIHQAAMLYFSCQKTRNRCMVIISGGDVLASGQSEAVIYQNELLNVGVKKSDILLESRSMNTYQNAEFTSAILKSKKLDTIFLVTSGMHMKRALLYFSQFGIEAIPVIADYIPLSISIFPLGYYFAITDFALHEYIGIQRFYLYHFFGWNSKSSLPGAF